MRNRVKRMLREAFWALPDVPSPGHDFVIVARAEARQLTEVEGFDALTKELGELVAQLAGDGAHA